MGDSPGILVNACLQNMVGKFQKQEKEWFSLKSIANTYPTLGKVSLKKRRKNGLER